MGGGASTLQQQDLSDSRTKPVKIADVISDTSSEVKRTNSRVLVLNARLPQEVRDRVNSIDSTASREMHDSVADGSRRSSASSVKYGIMNNTTQTVIKNALSGFEISEEDMNEIVLTHMEKRIYNVNHMLIRRGDPGEKLYIIEYGLVDVILNNYVIRTIGPGRTIGEHALLYNAPRSANIRCSTKCCIWSLHIDILKSVLKPIVFEPEYRKRALWLLNIPEFATLSAYDMSRLITSLELKIYQKGDILYKEGDIYNTSILIESGTLKIYSTRDDIDTADMYLEDIDNKLVIIRHNDFNNISARSFRADFAKMVTLSQDDLLSTDKLIDTNRTDVDTNTNNILDSTSINTTRIDDTHRSEVSAVSAITNISDIPDNQGNTDNNNTTTNNKPPSELKYTFSSSSSSSKVMNTDTTRDRRPSNCSNSSNGTHKHRKYICDIDEGSFIGLGIFRGKACIPGNWQWNDTRIDPLTGTVINGGISPITVIATQYTEVFSLSITLFETLFGTINIHPQIPMTPTTTSSSSNYNSTSTTNSSKLFTYKVIHPLIQLTPIVPKRFVSHNFKIHHYMGGGQYCIVAAGEFISTDYIPTICDINSDNNTTTTYNTTATTNTTNKIDKNNTSTKDKNNDDNNTTTSEGMNKENEVTVTATATDITTTTTTMKDVDTRTQETKDENYEGKNENDSENANESKDQLIQKEGAEGDDDNQVEEEEEGKEEEEEEVEKYVSMNQLLSSITPLPTYTPNKSLNKRYTDRTTESKDNNNSYGVDVTNTTTDIKKRVHILGLDHLDDHINTTTTTTTSSMMMMMNNNRNNYNDGTLNTPKSDCCTPKKSGRLSDLSTRSSLVRKSMSLSFDPDHELSQLADKFLSSMSVKAIKHMSFYHASSSQHTGRNGSPSNSPNHSPFNPNNSAKIVFNTHEIITVTTPREDLKDDRDKTLYALKILSKADIIEMGQIRHVADEVKLLSMMSSPFIIKLYGTYQTSNEIVLVTELLSYGDLWSVIYKNEVYTANGGLTITLAQFYMTCTISALSHIHDHGIVYRDLKPENILLDKNGYIKLIDFGFAKKVPYTKIDSQGKKRTFQKTYTLCGTPEYMSPEMIFNLGHDHATDIWSLGVLLYEMIMSVTPFAAKRADNMRELFMNIRSIEKNGMQLTPEFINICGTSKLDDLLLQLLKTLPNERLGVRSKKTSDIFLHRFFNNINLSALHSLTLIPEYIPTLHAYTHQIQKINTVRQYDGSNELFKDF